jgi:hypothetical protein
VRQGKESSKAAMAEDSLHYDRMVENALRGVLREALTVVVERGLPGDHHFYITLRTDHPGVSLSKQLKERYPTEITIVLQHQYWGLEVREDGFDVTLSFSDVPEPLSVPYDAVTAFADPSVRFGLQFNVVDAQADDEMPSDEVSRARERQGEPESSPSDAGVADSPDKVVTLDAFRKK